MKTKMLVQSKGAREAGNTVGVGRQGCEQSRIGQCHNPNNNGWVANNHAAANSPCLSASRSAELPRVEDQKRQTAGQVLERPPSPSPFLNERPSHTRACVLCLPLHPPLQCPIQPNPHIGCDYASNSLHKHDRHFQQWRARHRRHCGPVDKQARKQALQRLVQVE